MRPVNAYDTISSARRCSFSGLGQGRASVDAQTRPVIKIKYLSCRKVL